MDGPDVATVNGTAGGGAVAGLATAPADDLDGGDGATTSARPSSAASVPRILVAAFSADRTSLELLVDNYGAYDAVAAMAVCRVVPYAADGTEGAPFLLRSSPRSDAAAAAAAWKVVAVACGPLPADLEQAVVSWSADGVGGWSGSRMVVSPVPVQKAADAEERLNDLGRDVTGTGVVPAIDPTAGSEPPPVGPATQAPAEAADEAVSTTAAGLGDAGKLPDGDDAWAVSGVAGVPPSAGDGIDASNGGGLAASAATGSAVDAAGDSGSDHPSARDADVSLGQLPSAVDSMDPNQPADGIDSPTGVTDAAAAAAAVYAGAGAADGAAAVDGSVGDSTADTGTTAGAAGEGATNAADDPDPVEHPFDPADTYEAASAAGAPVASGAAMPTAAELAAAAASAAEAAMAAYNVPLVEHATAGEEGWPDAAVADAAAEGRAAEAARPSAAAVTVVGSRSRVPLFLLLAVAGSLYASLRRVRARRGASAWSATTWGLGSAAPRRFPSTATAGLTHAVASAAVVASGLLALVSPASAGGGGRAARRPGSPLSGDQGGGGGGLGGAGPLTVAAAAAAAASVSAAATDEESPAGAFAGSAAAKGDDSWDNSWDADGGGQAAGEEEPWGPTTTWATGATTVVGRRSKDRAD